jgi:hypothetical protein
MLHILHRALHLYVFFVFFFVQPKQRKTDVRFGTWDVRFIETSDRILSKVLVTFSDSTGGQIGQGCH